MSVEGFIAIAATIFVAWYFYAQSKKEKNLYFDLSSRSVASQESENLGKIEIYFDGTPIEGLTRYDLMIWSRATEPVRRADILSSDPLRIGFGDVRPLAVEHPTYSRVAIDASLLRDENEYYLEFEIMERGDAIHAAFLLDSGHDDLVRNLTLEGSVAGMPQGISKESRFAVGRGWLFGFFMAGLMFLILSGFSAFALYTGISGEFSDENQLPLLLRRIVAIFFGLIAAVGAFFIGGEAFGELKLYPRLMPKSAREFFERKGLM